MHSLSTREVQAVAGAASTGLGYAASPDVASGTLTAFATFGELAVPVKLPLGKNLTTLVALALKVFPQYAYKG
jgi:hypothetical protein